MGGAGVAQAQKTVVEPADIVHLKRVEAPMVSPDGKLVAYTVDTPVAAGKHRDAHIWLAPADQAGAARPFTVSGAAESSPEWSPDGMHLAFLSDRPNPLMATFTGMFSVPSMPGIEC